MQILEYNRLDYSKVREQYQRVVTLLKQDDFAAADVKKLTPTSYYRAKLDYTNRLLFKIVTYQGKRYALLLEIIHNHNYRASKFLQGVKVDESQIIPSLELATPTLDSLSYLNEQSNSFHVLDRIISFDETQQAILCQRTPLIIIGAAGSGKTALTLERLKECHGKVLYVTHSVYLVENARNLYYGDQYYKYQNDEQHIDFLSYGELLATYSVPAGHEVTGELFASWLRKQPSCQHWSKTDPLM